MTETQKPDLASLRIRREEIAPSPSRRGPNRRLIGWLILGLIVLVGIGIVFMRGRLGSVTVQTAVVERLVPGAAGSVLTATGYVVALRFHGQSRIRLSVGVHDKLGHLLRAGVSFHAVGKHRDRRRPVRGDHGRGGGFLPAYRAARTEIVGSLRKA